MPVHNIRNLYAMKEFRYGPSQLFFAMDYTWSTSPARLIIVSKDDNRDADERHGDYDENDAWSRHASMLTLVQWKCKSSRPPGVR